MSNALLTLVPPFGECIGNQGTTCCDVLRRSFRYNGEVPGWLTVVRTVFKPKFLLGIVIAL